jgi:hypothetical protein
MAFIEKCLKKVQGVNSINVAEALKEKTEVKKLDGKFTLVQNRQKRGKVVPKQCVIKTNNMFEILQDEVIVSPNIVDGVVIVGDSTLKNQESEVRIHNKNYFINCNRGAKIENLPKTVHKIVKHECQNIPKILITAVGERNVAEKEDNGDIMNKYRQMIREIKNKAQTNVIIGILPKFGKNDIFNGKAFIINRRIESLCKEHDMVFWDFWENFKGNSSLYSKDGKMLGTVGISRLGRLLNARILILENEVNQVTYFLKSPKN